MALRSRGPWSERGSLLAAAAAVGSCAGLLAGCNGIIGTDTDSLEQGGRSPVDPNAKAVGATLRRLTVPQYHNTVADLFGGAVTVNTVLEEDTALYGFSAIGAARLAVSARGTELYEQAALEVASQAVASAAFRDAFPCAPAATVDDACTQSFVDSFGRRAWRRPLSDEERARYVAVARQAATTLEDFWGGIEFALAGLLQSPHFLYRVELGEPHPEHAGVRVLTDLELATRLSFFLWNSTPDAELLAAAEKGELASSDGLLAQAERLLASERAQPAISHFFTEMLHLDKLKEVKQSPDAFPEVTPTLGPAMRTETLRFLEYLVDEGRDYRELFTSTTTFVNDELAAIYGVDAPGGAEFAQVMLPADGVRAGFLGHASFLSTNAHVSSTSPTHRGMFVRETLLCQGIPPPPPDVIAELPEIDPSLGPRTARQKLEMHQENPGCASCHRVIDPIGLALEHFDAIGRYRETDQGMEIDASGDLDGVVFDGARSLGEVIADHPSLVPCLVRNAIRHATGRLEGAWDEPHIEDLARSMAADGHRIRGLLLSLVQNPSFRLVGELR